MLERAFLAIVGALYAGLAAWCAVAPASTSKTVGFELQGGSGRSEFLTVYCGLELGMALVFLLRVWAGFLSPDTGRLQVVMDLGWRWSRRLLISTQVTLRCETAMREGPSFC